jgi:hypothetical protein
MKATPVRALTAALLAACLGCATAAAPGSAPADSGGAELAAVLDAVRQAVSEAQTRDVPGFPPLKRVVLKLQTTVSQSAGGRIRYLVASVGTTVSSETVSTLELEFAPVPPHRTAVPEESLKDALAQAIHLAKSGLARGAEGDPPLSMKAVSIDLKFTVSASGTAGATVTILPVGLTGTGTISRERVHSVTLTFSG